MDGASPLQFEDRLASWRVLLNGGQSLGIGRSVGDEFQEMFVIDLNRPRLEIVNDMFEWLDHAPDRKFFADQGAE